MPSYRTMGSLPRKRHIAHRTSPAIATRASTTKKSSPRPASAGPTASPITCGRRRACARSRPPARVRSNSSSKPALRHHHLKSGAMKPAGDPVTGRVPLLLNADVVLPRCRPAQPQAELYRNAAADEVLFVHQGRGTLSTHVRRPAVPAVRLRRHPALHDLSPRLRRRRRSPTCSSIEAAEQRRASRRAISTPTASFASAPLSASATCTARANRSSSTASRTRRC